MSLFATVKKHAFAIITLLAMGSPAFAQLVVNQNYTNNQLAQLLAGTGVTISNVVVNCSPNAYGYFNGTNSNIGLTEGLILTSGDITNAPGPNFSESTSTSNYPYAGYSLLTNLAGYPTYDACVFQFKIVPIGDTIKFNFVFGSEEYLEFVNLGYNDAFGFFISGPNPSGGSYVNKNMAVVPGTSIPVTIDAINNFSYSQYFTNNPVYVGQTVEYDGFTKNLQAVSRVIPCQTYDLILAIADAGDDIYDSGVFIEKITSDNVQLTASTQAGTPTGIEGCNNGIVTFTRTTPSSSSLTVNYMVSGTATQGSDYNNIGNSITIPAFQTTATLNINLIADGLPEGTETIIVYTVSPCNGVPLDSAVISIVDSIPLTVSPTQVNICNGQSTQLTASGAATYQWSPPLGLNSTTNPTVTASPNTTTTYTVTGTVGACTKSRQTTVTVNQPTTGNINPSPDTTVCEGSSVVLTAPAGSNYSWSPSGTLSNTNQQSTTATPSTTTLYSLSYTEPQCNTTQSLSTTVIVNPTPTVSFSGLDTVYCETDPAVTLTGSPAGGVFTGTGVSGSQFDPAAAGTGGPYTITYTYTDQNGCSNSDAQQVSVGSGTTVTISGLDPQYCEGQGDVLLTGSPSGGTFSGSGISNDTFSVAAVGVGGPYIVTYTYFDTNGGCLNTVKDTTQVFANPDASFSGLDTAYCDTYPAVTLTPGTQGGTFSGTGINGSTFDPAQAGPGGPYTISYTLTVNGCSDTTSQDVTVYQGTPVSFTGVDPTYCLTDTSLVLTPNVGGGTFSGNGINADTFSVMDAGVGTHIITYTLTDNFCTNTASDTVVVYAVPTASISGLDTSYCTTDAAVTVMVSPQGGSLTGQGISGNTFNPAQAGVGGPYTIQYSYSDQNACSDMTQVQVSVYQGTPVSFSGLSSAYCADEMAVTLVPSVTGGTFTGSGVSGTTFDPDMANIGPNTVTYTYTNNDGCVTTSSQNVTVNALPQLDWTELNDAYCLTSGSVELEPTPPGGELTGTGIIGTNFTPSAAGIGGPYTIQYVYFNSNECVDTITQEVYVTDIPTVSAEMDTTIYLGEEAGLLATSPSSGIQSFTWTPAEGLSCTDCANPVASPEDTTVYYVTVEVNGCASIADSVIIFVITENEYALPTAFTPNGDGQNDRFYILTTGGATVKEFKVFNRWGQAVHDGTFPWDGTLNGKQQPVGTYVCYAVIELPESNKDIIVQQNITLLR